MQIAIDVTESIRTIPRRSDSAIWIAHSGGLDSTVLLHACIEELGVSSCTAIHIDHGINPDSSEWAAHCQKVCDLWDIVLEIERVQIPDGNVELQSRLVRYQKFEQRLNTNDLVLTAHHADDVAETQLWQFLTGRAVVGIADRKVLGKGYVVRPFLQVTKQQLRDYAEKYSLSWVEDPSNADVSLDRNWIRHRMLPAIEQRFSDIRTRLAELAPSHLPTVQRGPLDLTNSMVDASHIRAWLLAYGANPPSSVIDEIIRQSNARQDSSPIIQVAEERQVRRYRGSLYFVTLLPAFDPQDATSGQDMELSNGSMTWGRCSGGLSQNQTFQVRNRIHLAGTKIAIRTNAMSKSLSSLFQEHGVAPWLRDGWPILMKDERVVCIPGIAVADEIQASVTNEPTYIPTWKPKTD